MLLLVSLFLPWFTLLFFSLSAVQLLGLIGGAGDSNIKFGGAATLGLVRLFVALMPLGCIAVIVLAMRGLPARLAGTITGLLPAAVFLLLFLQSSMVLNVMGAGFVIAILAGIGLVAFSRSRS
jgi:hypothetical protein